MSGVGHAVLLLAAGLVAGLVGSAGGITSLVSYPALLLVGVPARAAVVTNNVALVASMPGAMLGSREELAGRGPWLRRWSLVAVAGGAAGAVALLLTPPGPFRRIVPFLVLAGVIALVLEPWVPRSRVSGRVASAALPVALVFSSAYTGYFGAGSGVMTLATMLLLVDRDLPRANALKNVLVGAANVMTALLFAFFGPVHWALALPLAIGCFIGSRLAPAVVRRVPAGPVRAVIALLGLALVVELLV